MPLFDTILGSVIGGFFDRSANKATNAAQQQANQANIVAQAANQEKGLQALTGQSPFGTSTRNDQGGFDVTAPGAEDAARTRADLAFGDIARAGNINRATTDFQFTLPSLSDAQGIVNRDRALQDTGIIQPGLDKIALLKQRQFGGLNNTGETANTIDALSQFSAQNRIGGEQDALNLFNKSRESDNALLSQLIANNSPRAPAPTFSGGLPGGGAANVIAQSPPAATVPNLSGAINPATGSNVVSNILGELQRQEDISRSNKIWNALLNRGIGNEGTFSNLPTETV